jgi:hypothetical protein
MREDYRRTADSGQIRNPGWRVVIHLSNRVTSRVPEMKGMTLSFLVDTGEQGHVSTLCTARS